MATETANIKLKLIEDTDLVTQDFINANAEILDTQLTTIKTSIPDVSDINTNITDLQNNLTTFSTRVTAVQLAVAGKASSDVVYLKTEVDTLLGTKSDKTDLTALTTRVTTLEASVATLNALPWTEKCIISNPATAYITPSLPLSRNGTLSDIDFYVTGTPTAATTITAKQGSTTIGSVSISVAGKTTLTVAITGTLDDLFTYLVTGAGLSACVITCNQKWVNR